MSRFLLRNAVRDPKFAALRKKNESKVQLRPFVGGKPLPPGATRILLLSDLTPAIIAEIEGLVAIGNIEFLAIGRFGPAVDFMALRTELGQLPAVPVTVAVETAVAAEVVTEVAVSSVKAKPAPAYVEPEPPIAAPEPAVATEAIEKVWTREELEAARLVDLRDILNRLGGKTASKNKSVVVDEILAAQGGV